MSRTKHYMGIDQHGVTYHDLGTHPRKALLERFGRKHADKIYLDLKDGRTVHTGYVIAGLWIQLYEVYQMRKPA